jgi:hypothetical protein
MSRLALLAPLFILASLPAAAQTALPKSFDGWNGNPQSGLTPPEIHNGDKATSTIANMQAAALKEFGLAGGEEAAYTRGAEKLNVALYRMKDPSGAFGEYCFLRSPEMPPARLGENAVLSKDRALVQTGSFVLEVRGSDLAKYEPDLQALVAAVAPHAEHGPLPFLAQRLPASDMVERSDRYILGPKVLGHFLPFAQGDWLGFSEGAEAELAQYRSKPDEFTLLLADFPTPQLASRKLAELEKDYGVNADAPKNDFPRIFGKRSLTMLALTIGAGTKKEANALLDQVQSGTELTWNEPSFEATQPGWVVILFGTFVGTGIICIFAMIASLAFGGARLLIKRALPNKVFDRSSQMQILQLGLSSKPINAEDFYGLGRSSGK